MNEMMLRQLYHSVTPQWKKDYNRKYYMANKEKWSNYYTKSRSGVTNDYRATIEALKEYNRTANKTWKESKRNARESAKRGYIDREGYDYVYNPSTNWYDIVPTTKREKYSKEQYKQDVKDARRAAKQQAREVAYQMKKASKEYKQQVIEEVKSQMKNIKLSDMKLTDKIKAINEGRRIIRAAKVGSFKLNMQATITQIKSLGFNPYA